MPGTSEGLKDVIMNFPLANTHDHTPREPRYTSFKPDILVDIFHNYILSDLVLAGADPEAVKQLANPDNPDIENRFRAVFPAWERCRNTGYGQAVCLIAKLLYGIEEITPENLRDNAHKSAAFRLPGARIRLMRDIAKFDHVQVNSVAWDEETIWDLNTGPDETAPDFFFYDIRWAPCCTGMIDLALLRAKTGIEAHDVSSLRKAYEEIFVRCAPTAVAVKTQHAYLRTLAWRCRSDAEVNPVIMKLARGQQLDEQERLCLGDWGLALGAELAAEYHIPMKIHTGTYAGNNTMRIDWIRPGLLCDFFLAHPGTKFVLMHTGYPYTEELIGLVKHFANVYADMCWAWSINPYRSADFLRSMMHCVPDSKIMVFGGDAYFPSASVAYGYQARQWLLHTLLSEVEDCLIKEKDAIMFARRIMRENAQEVFNISRLRDRKKL